ncbi:hypothetical protein [Rhizobium sp. SYY.PMSO]|uniref:hypothetical protein n=1 Tax=Rhizobium sp. SYY.PMSO TaxID=3382192 RepID=UPI00398FD0B4
MALWRKWQEVHQRRYELCVLQQTREARILQTVGRFPIVKLQVPGEEKPVVAYTDQEIECALPGPEMAEARQCAKDKLRSLRKMWNAEDERIGYSRAYEAEREVMDAELKLANALWKRPAHSIEGVTAKLHPLVEIEDPNARMEDSPWPMLRSLLADMIGMRA